MLALTTGPAGAARAAGDGGGANVARPNVIVMLIDDMGMTDLGCQGSPFYETPGVDRLAREGMRFTQAYSACTVCSPTRAAMLTGRYPARLHITDWIAGHVRPRAKLKIPDWTKHLPLEEITIAELLKPAGYAAASIGKWHLGGPEFYPDKQGFDVNLGGTDRGQPPSYFSPYKIATLPDGPDGEFLTDRESTEACKWIAAHKDGPFFLYLPHHAVHTPLMGKPEVVAKYKARAKPGDPQRNATYAALVETVSDSMTRILDQLDALKIADRTVVLFTSDNGGLIGGTNNPVTANLGLRAGKGSAYEGGVRVPFIVKWPGVTKPGSTCDTPVITVDILPTVAQIAGVAAPAERPLDGESLVPLLRGTGGLKRDAIFWHYPHYHPGGATPYSAVRQGDWRLVTFYEDNHIELYNLKNDPQEKTDLAAAESKKAGELKTRLNAWLKDVGAQMPTPNPDYSAEGEQPARKRKKNP
jgi:arylsulfatase A-like enzyme